MSLNDVLPANADFACAWSRRMHEQEEAERQRRLLARAARRQARFDQAAALSVAIPAVFGYNIFAHRLNRFDGELDGFGSELIAIMVREGRI